MPLCAGVGDPEAVALGVALGFAARLSNHHCQIAPVVKGVAHSLAKEGGLQSPAPQLRDRRSSSEKSDAIVHT